LTLGACLLYHSKVLEETGGPSPASNDWDWNGHGVAAQGSGTSSKFRRNHPSIRGSLKSRRGVGSGRFLHCNPRMRARVFPQREEV
jgi:hypothetical protein